MNMKNSLCTADEAEVGSTLAMKRGINIVRNPKTEIPEAPLKKTDVLQKVNKIFRR